MTLLDMELLKLDLVTCPFCQQVVMKYRLCAHVLDTHWGAAVNGKKLHENGSQLVCWCGTPLPMAQRMAGMAWALEDHLEARGGIDQHILEVALGVYQQPG